MNGRIAVAAAALCGHATAQDGWPSRPVRLISTSVAGGNIDVMCRIIAEKLSARLGQPVVVDNKPGAATVLGTAEAARAQPDGYTFLVTIMSSIVGKECGVPLNHVPYKGEVQATADVMNGTLDVAWVSILIAKPLAAAGKIRALAITGPKRFVAWPELATFAEQGFPGFEMPVWGGAYLPAGTPKPIVERLSREIGLVLRMPEVSERLIAMGQLPIGNTPEEFAENYRRDFPRWEALIKASGAKVE